MTGLIPKEKKAKKAKSADKLIGPEFTEPESTEDQPILKADGGKSDKLFRFLFTLLIITSSTRRRNQGQEEEEEEEKG